MQLHKEAETKLQQKADNHIRNTESEMHTIQDYKSHTDKNIHTILQIDALFPLAKIRSLQNIEKEQNIINHALQEMKGKYMNVSLICTENEHITDISKQRSFATISDDAVPSEVLCTGTPQFPVTSLPPHQPAKPREVMMFNVQGVREHHWSRLHERWKSIIVRCWAS